MHVKAGFICILLLPTMDTCILGGLFSTCSFVNVPLQLCKCTISAFFSLNVNMVWKQLATGSVSVWGDLSDDLASELSGNLFFGFKGIWVGEEWTRKC